MNIDKIRERIKKLLKLSSDTSSPEEAAIAADRAARLMRKHQIDHAEVVFDDLNDADQIVMMKHPTGYRNVPGWLDSLAVSVAKSVDTHVSRAYNPIMGTTDYRLYGYEPDVELAQWLLTYLFKQIQQISAKHRATVKGEPQYEMSPRSYMFSYRCGLSRGIRDKLAEVYKDGEEAVSDTGRALVVAKTNAIEAKFGSFGYKSARRNVEHGAYSQGVRDGQNVSVNQGVAGPKAGPRLLT